MDIKKISNYGEQGGARWIFFLHISILFKQCNNKNIIYQQFLLMFRLYILHLIQIDLFLMCFLEKLTFGWKKYIYSHSFWPRWLKRT